MSKRGVLLFALSLLAGVVAGGLSKPKAAEVVPDASAPGPREARGSRDKWRLDDFLTAVRQQSSSEIPASPRIAAELSLWSEDELRAALDECMHTPTGSLLLVWGEIQEELFKAWIARNPDAALAWFDAIDPPSLKRRLAKELAWYWPSEKAEEGYAYLLKNRELLGESEWYFQKRLIQSRAKDGPDAVYATLQQFRVDGTTVAVGELPDGFDYAALLARDLDALSAKKARLGEHELGLLKEGLVRGWYGQDHESAFDWVLHEKGAAGLGFLLNDSAERNGETAWLPGKIATLPKAQQDEFLTATRERWLHDMQGLGGFAHVSKDPALQEKAQALAVEGVVYGNIEHSLEVIGANPDLERRLAILEESPIGPAPRKPLATFHDGTAKYLREALGGWGVESGRIDSIIARFRQYEPATP